MCVHKDHLEQMRSTLVTSVALLLGVASACALADNNPSTAASYVPTTEDWMGVNDAIQHYRWGVERHDQKAYESAFWEDGVNIAVPSPGQEISIPVRGANQPPPPRDAVRPGPNAGPPPATNGSGGELEVWHLPLSDYYHFESPTRATHYEYFLSIYPQKESQTRRKGKKNVPPMEARRSIVGWPGHYEDVLEKRNGEWRILSRKSMINQK